MNVTSTTQTQYIQATNKSSTNKENEANKILTVEELLGKEGYEEFNKLISNKSEKDQNRIKLLMSFSMSIKSESVVNGKLQIERETKELDIPSALSKFEQMVAKAKQSTGDLVGDIKLVLEGLRTFYSNKSTTSTNISNKEDSVVDDFLDDLYTNTASATTTASAITKETIQNKVNEYAQTLMDTRGDTPESKLEVSKMLNDYKKELLQDYKNSLDGAKNDKMTLQQEAIIKVLLNENTKEASSLEKLLSQKT